MKAIIYYSLVVLIWGSTWIAVKYQVLNLTVEHAIFYRFFISAILLFGFLKLFKQLRPIDKQTQLLCMAQGSLMFCLNFYAFYQAAQVLSSGLLAILFSTATLMNGFNNWLWYGKRPTKFTVIGTIIGLIGIIVVFYPDVKVNDDGWQVFWAVILCLLGTYSFSTGNMLSIQIHKREPHLLTTNAWSIFYGSSLMLFIIVLVAEPLTFQWNVETISSLLYLISFGTIIVFLVYLKLVRMIGVDRVAYTTILMPVIALLISTVVENYQWTLIGMIGFSLILFGNFLVFHKRKNNKKPKKSLNI